MTWYPDWVVALEEVSKGVEHAVVTRRNAEDIIREIKKMQAEITELGIPTDDVIDYVVSVLGDKDAHGYSVLTDRFADERCPGDRHGHHPGHTQRSGCGRRQVEVPVAVPHCSHRTHQAGVRVAELRRALPPPPPARRTRKAKT